MVSEEFPNGEAFGGGLPGLFSFWGVGSDGKLRREFPTLLSITTEKVPPNSVYCTVGGLLQMKWDKLLSEGRSYPWEKR